MAYMKRHRRKRRLSADINVVPYIDVMLVLLVIFMITTPMLTQGVKVDLPQASAKKIPPKSEKPMIVTVNNKGQYFLNISDHPKLPLTSQSLLLRVKTELSKDHSRQVFVRGDKSANYGKVVSAMVLLQKAGAPSVGLMTDDEA
ncbi:protein TolR [Thiotrichales bacterium 19S11-10]|nr:protein TolR [Thiotrichales bacterium 19S11-10]MCF6807710.1 protein TolR [Thiotrichales bacterium 19S9-11]MCF6811679.1 protein TolR [Thiotrichales bacterium 19S9-12]